MVIPREPRTIVVLGLRRDYTPTPEITLSYLLGVLHDATVRKNTYRIATKDKPFANVLKQGIGNLGCKSWIYKEGKTRNLWIVEFSKSLLKNVKTISKQNKVDFIRGFFDAEGGIARDPNVRFYIYLCQKNYQTLLILKEYLSDLGIKSGVIHNPSKMVDPNYWRFYISKVSYGDFATLISSNHPEKFKLLRMKI